MPEKITDTNKGPWAKENAETSKDVRTLHKEAFDRILALNIKNEGSLPEGINLMLDFAHYFLDREFAEFHEEFEILPNGSVRTITKTDLSIEYWAPAEKAEVTAEGIRIAAAQLQEFFPQIKFTFTEDRGKGRFAYTAVLA